MSVFLLIKISIFKVNIVFSLTKFIEKGEIYIPNFVICALRQFGNAEIKTSRRPVSHSSLVFLIFHKYFDPSTTRSGRVCLFSFLTSLSAHLRALKFGSSNKLHYLIEQQQIAMITTSIVG